LVWPGAEADDDASANRLRVALTRLRRAGLGEVLVTTDSGWMLKRSVPIEISRVVPVPVPCESPLG
jgi:hypothetical protein